MAQGLHTRQRRVLAHTFVAQAELLVLRQVPTVACLPIRLRKESAGPSETFCVAVGRKAASRRRAALSGAQPVARPPRRKSAWQSARPGVRRVPLRRARLFLSLPSAVVQIEALGASPSSGLLQAILAAILPAALGRLAVGPSLDVARPFAYAAGEIAP